MGPSTWLAALLAVAPASSPEDSVFELTWSAPDACPPRADVIAEVTRLLGDLKPQEAWVSANGRVRATDEGYALILEIRSGESVGERALQGESCKEVVDAAALIMAIAINPSVLERASGPAPVPDPREDPEPASDADAEPVTVPSPPLPAPRRPAFVVRAGAGAGAFLLPGPTGTVAVAVGVVGRFWRVEAEGAYWFAREVTRADDVGGRFQLGWAGVRGCGAPERGDFEFPLCAGIDLGAMRGTGLGDALASVRSRNAIWLAVRGGPSLVWRGNEWVGFWLAADGIVPVLRPRFDIQPSGREVFRVNPAGLQVQLGVEFRPF